MSKVMWQPIPGYEGLYEVSNFGVVRSLYRYKKELKPMISNSGYERVDLFKNGRRKQHSVHRLVALCFCEKPENCDVVNHKDECKTNNNAENLEWVTHSENCRWGTAIGRRTIHLDYSKRKVNNANQIKACSKPIMQFSKNGEFIKTWSSASECARENNWTISNIRRACQRGYSAYGFYFKEVV